MWLPKRYLKCKVFETEFLYFPKSQFITVLSKSAFQLLRLPTLESSQTPLSLTLPSSLSRKPSPVSNQEKKRHPLWRTVWRCLQKLKLELPYYPVISFLNIHLDKTIIQNDICTFMLITALFTVAKIWKQTKHTLTDKWIKEIQYTHIFWPPDVKSWLIGKDPDAGKWRQNEKRAAEDEMFR